MRRDIAGLFFDLVVDPDPIDLGVAAAGRDTVAGSCGRTRSRTSCCISSEGGEISCRCSHLLGGARPLVLSNRLFWKSYAPLQ
ncbi:hypothetical protein KSP39_PZI016705 [Platanthera zijinensis]|uniref:Uncharacterized protein n=1 Tax=Platanthera zijinensis TaxID=2320716 RepID=A0AAP0G0Y1_9ASPA